MHMLPCFLVNEVAAQVGNNLTIVYFIQIIGTIIAIAMLFRTFRKDNEEKLDRKASTAEVEQLRGQVKEKADQKSFDALKEEFKQQTITNEENHKQIRTDLKEMVQAMEENVMERIKLGNEVVIEKISKVNSEFNSSLRDLIRELKKKKS